MISGQLNLTTKKLKLQICIFKNYRQLFIKLLKINVINFIDILNYSNYFQL